MKKTQKNGLRFKLSLLAVAVLGMSFGGLTGCESLEEAFVNDMTAQGIAYVTDISPQVGNVGTQVTIIGNLFGEIQGENGQVLFYGAADGGGVAAAIEGWTETAIFCRVPNVDAKNLKINVQVVRDDGIKAASVLFVVTDT